MRLLLTPGYAARVAAAGRVLELGCGTGVVGLTAAAAAAAAAAVAAPLDSGGPIRFI